MSWIDTIKRDFVITTGDGAKFKPNWLNANRVMDFNIAVFNYKNVKGSKVDRGQPMGLVYDIEIYFQGADYLTTSEDFKTSSENPKPWQIVHPMYGPLFVQPLGLRFDNREYNVTKVTGQIMETIGAKLLKVNISPIDTIQAKKLSTDITTATAYTVTVPTAFADDIAEMQEKSTFIERAQLAFVNGTENYQQVVNTYNRANAAIDNAFADSFTAIRAMQDLINLPANFINTIGRRVNFLLTQSLDLYAALTGLTTPRLKRLYENNVATIITTMCSASVTNPTPSDYRRRADVVAIIADITTAYNTYITNLDTLQTDTGGTPTSYVPDFDSQTQINTLVKFTVANLFSIASGAKQERVYVTPTQTNLILLAYKLYGLLPDDSTISQVIQENNICLNELIQIKKGREFVYYV